MTRPEPQSFDLPELWPRNPLTADTIRNNPQLHQAVKELGIRALEDFPVADYEQQFVAHWTPLTLTDMKAIAEVLPDISDDRRDRDAVVWRGIARLGQAAVELEEPDFVSPSSASVFLRELGGRAAKRAARKLDKHS